MWAIRFWIFCVLVCHASNRSPLAPGGFCTFNKFVSNNGHIFLNLFSFPHCKILLIYSQSHGWHCAINRGRPPSWANTTGQHIECQVCWQPGFACSNLLGQLCFRLPIQQVGSHASALFLCHVSSVIPWCLWASWLMTSASTLHYAPVFCTVSVSIHIFM